ncbi:MAG: endonuclease/exonuclease/phosphatase family protein [Micromonosporaceae bacterium]|nr:endonuclease/exonuclease/phosphatase family protein [Micromonosporaceae bacterium]
MTVLTIATLNVNGLRRPRPPLLPLARRVPALGERLDAAPIDVLNLQEVYFYESVRLLREYLSSYPYVAYRRGPVGPCGALVTFSRHPLGPARYRSFAGIVPNQGSLRFRFRRALLSAIQGLTTVELSGLPVTIVNTHLTANRDGDWSRDNRFFDFQRAQLRRLNATLARRRRRPGLTIITGDFNIASDSDHYPLIVENGARLDPFAATNPVTFHATFLSPGEPAHRIDYVLLAGAATVVDTTTLFTEPVMIDGEPHYLSDHIGLSARVELTAPEPGAARAASPSPRPR